MCKGTVGLGHFGDAAYFPSALSVHEALLSTRRPAISKSITENGEAAKGRKEGPGSRQPGAAPETGRLLSESLVCCWFLLMN